MKTAKLPRFHVVAGAIALGVLIPAQARADAISFPMVAVAGAMILVPLTLFTVLVEGIVLVLGLRVPYRRTLLVLLAANLASLAAGIPVKIFNAWLYATVLPRPLAPYFRQYPLAVCLGTAIFFLVTLAVEYLVIATWCRNRTIPVRRGRLAVVVLIANTLTYAVLAPLHYFATRPLHDIREFTDDSRWAQTPPVELFYIGADGSLCAATTDGQGVRTVVPDTVREYQYLPEPGIFLYRNGADDLCLLRKSAIAPVRCWHAEYQFAMEQVACSPNGSVVAYLEKTRPGESYELTLHDADSGRTAKTGIVATSEHWYGPELAWSENPSKLYLRTDRTIEVVTVSRELTAARAYPVTGALSLTRVYGYSGTARWSGSDNWRWSLFCDERAGIEAHAVVGLDCHLEVTQGRVSFVLADNPGWLKLSNRQFDNVCILENGKELIFDDGDDIYLMDVAKRKVGRIVGGSDCVLLIPRYQRHLPLARN